MNYSIRPWCDDDRDQVVGLITSIQQREFGVAITADDQPDILDVKTFYRASGGEFWVARHGDSVVGTVAAINIGDGLIALRKLFVAAQHRGEGRGLAVRLMEVLLAWAHERSMRDIYLGTTSVMHAAHRFYERQGFIHVDRIELPASFPVMPVDSHFYRRRVSGLPEAASHSPATGQSQAGESPSAPGS